MLYRSSKVMGGAEERTRGPEKQRQRTTKLNREERTPRTVTWARTGNNNRILERWTEQAPHHVHLRSSDNGR